MKGLKYTIIDFIQLVTSFFFYSLTMCKNVYKIKSYNYVIIMQDESRNLKQAQIE